ncbi:Rpn family recombination-promoting nuclease/putative transposase [Sporosarcina soli]|uniref:Rpn family recombination-promoting nuclease/putative transposase n=1 Tax=Sporosarcina soli TaxID=334736 RepID=A0ABW0TKB3_9BACL
MKIQNPHDKFFKETMGNVETAKDFLMNYLPESVMQVVNLDTFELESRYLNAMFNK